MYTYIESFNDNNYHRLDNAAKRLDQAITGITTYFSEFHEYVGKKDYAKNAAFYDSLSAVKNDNVYTICPFNAYATNMEIAIADAYFIGKTIYPDKFSDIEINDQADEIYEALVGDKYQSVLDSEGHSFRKFKIGE